jgi:hypothetical protein
MVAAAFSVATRLIHTLLESMLRNQQSSTNVNAFETQIIEDTPDNIIVIVGVTIKKIGTVYKGKEIGQLYVRNVVPSVYRPYHELKDSAMTKLLSPVKSQTIRFVLRTTRSVRRRGKVRDPDRDELSEDTPIGRHPSRDRSRLTRHCLVPATRIIDSNDTYDSHKDRFDSRG